MELNDLIGSKGTNSLSRKVDKSEDINALINDIVTDQGEKMYKIQENGRYVDENPEKDPSKVRDNMDGSGMILFDHDFSETFEKSWDMRNGSKQGSLERVQVTENTLEINLTSRIGFPKTARRLPSDMTSFEFNSKSGGVMREDSKLTDQELDSLLV